jgi:hypothetical protein
MTPREDFQFLTARRHGAPAQIVPASEPAPAKPARKKAQRKQQAEPVDPARIADQLSQNNHCAQFYTVLTRENGKTAFVFWWDFQHWLSFNSSGALQDIRYLGTGKTWEEAREIAQREAPGKKIVNRYCPRTAEWF